MLRGGYRNEFYTNKCLKASLGPDPSFLGKQDHSASIHSQIQVSLGNKITVPQSVARSKFPWETRSQWLNPWPDPGFLGKPRSQSLNPWPDPSFLGKTRPQCLNPWPDPGFLGKQDHRASIRGQIQVSSNNWSLGHWWPAGQPKTLSNVLLHHIK